VKPKIDIAVCYHKESPIFESDALKPMQLGKTTSKIDLGMRGDDTGDNISEKNKYYAEDTAFYWLWKNSTADIKGIMHYRRFLDLSNPQGQNRNVILEDIKSPDVLISELKLKADNISEKMREADILIIKPDNIHDYFSGNMEEHFKASHIPEHLDYALEIIKKDFPDIYPIARVVLSGHHGYFTNLVIMKREIFDEYCQFKFAVLAKLERIVDVNLPEIADDWQYTARYTGFVGERLMTFFIEYLRKTGKEILEFPRITIVPRGTNAGDTKNYSLDAYRKKSQEFTIEPVFDNKAVAAMMATNDKYAPYCGVLLQSIIENASSGKNYDLVIAGTEISDINKKLLESMATANISVRVADISNYLGDMNFPVRAYFTIEMYYRFFIPKLFLKYDKVLYLDADLVTLCDIADLYETDIGNNWWGVTRDKLYPIMGFIKGTYENEKLLPYIKDKLKMDSVFNYFQSGVMIWNVKKCIADKVLDKCLQKLIEIEQPFHPDQDVMNSVANGENIHWLSDRWNVVWYVPLFCRCAQGSAAFETAMHLLETPFILHYASYLKPWDSPCTPNAHYFWQYARKTPFYEAILLVNRAKEEKEKWIEKLKKKIKKHKLLTALILFLIKPLRRLKRLIVKIARFGKGLEK